jgi:hypothetical protein
MTILPLNGSSAKEILPLFSTNDAAPRMCAYRRSIADAKHALEGYLSESKSARIDERGVRELVQRLGVRLHPLYCAIDSLCQAGRAWVDGNQVLHLRLEANR